MPAHFPQDVASGLGILDTVYIPLYGLRTQIDYHLNDVPLLESTSLHY